MKKKAVEYQNYQPSMTVPLSKENICKACDIPACLCYGVKMVFSLFGAYCIIWLHYALFSVLSQPRLILLCLFKMLITRERLTRGARRAQKKEENQQSVKWALLLQIVNPLMGFPWMRKSNKRTERGGYAIERREKIIAATSSVSIKKWCARDGKTQKSFSLLLPSRADCCSKALQIVHELFWSCTLANVSSNILSRSSQRTSSFVNISLFSSLVEVLRARIIYFAPSRAPFELLAVWVWVRFGR